MPTVRQRREHTGLGPLPGANPSVSSPSHPDAWAPSGHDPKAFDPVAESGPAWEMRMNRFERRAVSAQRAKPQRSGIQPDGERTVVDDLHLHHRAELTFFHM